MALSLLVLASIGSSFSFAADRVDIALMRRNGQGVPEERMTFKCLVDAETTDLQITRDAGGSTHHNFLTTYTEEVPDEAALVRLARAVEKGKIQRSPPSAGRVEIYKLRIHPDNHPQVLTVTLSSEGAGQTIRNLAPETSALIQFVEFNCKP